MTFSEDVKHVVGNGASARPEISYKIGTATAVQFDITAPGSTTLAIGDCRPDHATDRDVYECRYRPASGDKGSFDFRVGTNTQDTDDVPFAAEYIHRTKLTVDTVLPGVVTASSGYFKDAKLSDRLTGTVKTGTDIYTKVAFSKNMTHKTGDGGAGQPYLAYQIGTASLVSYDIVAAGATLASGDCRPDAATPADVYECMYTPKGADSGDFIFLEGVGSPDTVGNRTASPLYRHPTKLVIEQTGPKVLAASSGYFSNAGLTTKLAGR